MAKKSGPGKKGVTIKHEHFLNRELQALEFNRRVLAQAEDKSVPVLERLKFLCIVSSNLDEFFEIRVSGLKEQIKLAAATTLGPDGMTPLDVFPPGVGARAGHRREAVPALQRGDHSRAREGGHPVPAPRRLDADAAGMDPRLFLPRDDAVLTPIGLDPAHPFPRVFNKSLNFAVELEGRDAFGRDSRAAIVQAPRVLPRVIRPARRPPRQGATISSSSPRSCTSTWASSSRA
jgi:polyphosphate kinase